MRQSKSGTFLTTSATWRWLATQVGTFSFDEMPEDKNLCSCAREINSLQKCPFTDKHVLENGRNVFRPQWWEFISFPLSLSVSWIGVLTFHHRSGIRMLSWNKHGTMLATVAIVKILHYLIGGDHSVKIWSVSLTGTIDCLLSLSGHRSAPPSVTSLGFQNLACWRGANRDLTDSTQKVAVYSIQISLLESRISANFSVYSRVANRSGDEWMALHSTPPTPPC